MLIYSKNRYVPTDVNMMVIRGVEDDGYFYIHRYLYDQAVILSDLYHDEPSSLIKIVTGNTDTREDVEYFLKNIPSPINILGPFLLLVNKELLTPNDMIGAIHVMSGPLNFRKMINIPFEMRNQQPCFSISIREEYKVAWDRFFLTAIPYSENMFLPQTGNVASSPASTSVPQNVDVNDAQSIIDAISAAPVDTSNFDSDNFDVKQATEEVNNMSEEGMKAFAALDWDAIFGGDDEDEESEETEKPAPTPEPTIVQVPVEEPKEVTGVDALLNL